MGTSWKGLTFTSSTKTALTSTFPAGMMKVNLPPPLSVSASSLLFLSSTLRLSNS